METNNINKEEFIKDFKGGLGLTGICEKYKLDFESVQEKLNSEGYFGLVDESDIDRVVELLKGNKSVSEIANELNTSKSYINYLITKYDLYNVTKSESENEFGISDETIKKIIDEYQNTDITKRKLQNKYGLSYIKLTEIFKKYNIATKPQICKSNEVSDELAKQIVDEYQNTSTTRVKLHSKYNISYNNLAKIFKKYNVDTSTKTRYKKINGELSPELEKQIAEEYQNTDATKSSLQRKYNLSYMKLTDILAKYNVKSKTHGFDINSLTEDEKIKIIDAVLNNISMKQLSIELSIPYSIIYKLMQTELAETRRKIYIGNKDTITQSIINDYQNNESLHNISAKYSIKLDRVREILRENNIEVKEEINKDNNLGKKDISSISSKSVKTKEQIIEESLEINQKDVIGLNKLRILEETKQHILKIGESVDTSDLGLKKKESTKFNDEEIEDIIKKYKSGNSLLSIAKEYDTRIHKIKGVLITKGVKIRTNKKKKDVLDDFKDVVSNTKNRSKRKRSNRVNIKNLALGKDEFGEPIKDFYTREEKIEYCNKKYGEGNWHFMTHEEVLAALDRDLGIFY